MRKTFDARHRPFVDLPSSLSELDGPTEAGEVVLPTHLDWSSGRRYDLDDPLHRRRVYEIVLREGTLDELRRFDANEPSSTTCTCPRTSALPGGG